MRGANSINEGRKSAQRDRERPSSSLRGVSDDFVVCEWTKSSFTAQTRRFQPNDEKCPPYVQNSSFTARDRGDRPAPRDASDSLPSVMQ
jgi:hypothetical protein